MPPSQWTDCVGIYTYGNGNVYRGEFRHGNRDGFGLLDINFTGQSTDTMIGWDGPAIYVGGFKDGRLNGYGLPTGIGVLQVNAVGSLQETQVRLPFPGVYVGQFKDGKFSGHGAIVMSGAGYAGTFSDNAFKPGADR